MRVFFAQLSPSVRKYEILKFPNTMQHDALFQTIQIAANQIKIDVQQIFSEISARTKQDRSLYAQRCKKYEIQLTQLIDQLDSIESSEQSTRRKRKTQVSNSYIHRL